MHTIAKLGLAAALLIGGANATIAQDAGAEAGAEAGAAVDPGTTGSIGQPTYDSLITSLQAGTAPDLTTFTASSTVNCVGISSLQGDATADPAALDTALTDNQDAMTSLRSSIEGNADLMTSLETTCAASIPEFDVQNIVAVEAGADGAFTFYVDDRAS